MVPYRFVRAMFVLSFWGAALVCGCGAQEAVCGGGFGSFSAGFATGVTVSVGSVPKAGFATRMCRAKVNWNKQELVIEPGAWQINVDAMGIDLGLGAPVVAFVINRSDIDRFAKYEIYSLKTPPRELRTITGGDDYFAADTDLDGRIEIWTHDAAAVDGFENIPFGTLDFPPMEVLRFEQRKLIEVNGEFVPEFDRQIAMVRAQLDARSVNDFKHSDGALSTQSFVPVDQLQRLMKTKIRVLEMVWGYVYSNREEEGWRVLGEMWPAADLERIRAAILNARARSIRSQVEGVSALGPSKGFKKKHVMIYDRVSGADASGGNPLSSYYSPGLSGPTKDEHTFEADTFPIPILLRRPPAAANLGTEVTVNLVIDSAGKVRSAKVQGKPEEDLIQSTEDWRFIPAFKRGRPVASRLQMGVVPTQ